MNWQQILITVISIVLTFFLSWACESLIALIKAKVKNTNLAKFLTGATEIVTRAVKATYQTYVEGLKNEDLFNEAAQKKALGMAKDTAKQQLTGEMQAFIEQNYGDVDAWLENTIESVLYDLKN